MTEIEMTEEGTDQPPLEKKSKLQQDDQQVTIQFESESGNSKTISSELNAKN